MTTNPPAAILTLAISSTMAKWKSQALVQPLALTRRHTQQ